ncbi:MAG: S8 family peptidase [Candidatus Sericytochromatia bacterium]|nr:S8 family peptidase [Candidatus Sericytochromatia bacterium]
MARLLPLFLMGACLSACGHPALSTPPRGSNAQVQAHGVPGKVLVGWRKPALAERVLSRLQARRQASSEQAEAERGLLPVDLVELPTTLSPEDFAREAGEAAAWVEPERIWRLPPVSPEPGVSEFPGGEALPSKRFSARQAWLEQVKAPAAWRISRGRAEVRIAVVDTGIDETHPALRGQIAGTWRASGTLAKFGLGSARDDNGHGTHCAGIAVANGTDGAATGVAPGCRVLAIKALDRHGAGSTSDIVRGIRWALAHEAKVLSLSVGGVEQSQALTAAVSDALRAGVVVVAAMGNEGKEVKNFPAALAGVIAVGAVNHADQPASFSTRGSWISVCAPGVGIWSTSPTYPVTLGRENSHFRLGEGKLSGTSMATPMVAGLAALMLSANPNLSPAQVKVSIERHAHGLGAGFSPRTGYGRVDLSASLAAVRKD